MRTAIMIVVLIKRGFASIAAEERFCNWHLGAPDWF